MQEKLPDRQEFRLVFRAKPLHRCWINRSQKHQHHQLQ